MNSLIVEENLRDVDPYLNPTRSTLKIDGGKIEDDYAAAREALSKADVTLAAAWTEERRLNSLFAETSSSIASLGKNISAAKRRLLEAAAAQNDLPELRREMDNMKRECQWKISVLSFVGTFSLPDAIAARMRAELAERDATAAVLYAQYLSHVGQLSNVLSELASIDGAAVVDLANSPKQKLLVEANRIRGHEIPRMNEDLKRHLEVTAREQEIVSPNLFNA